MKFRFFLKSFLIFLITHVISLNTYAESWKFKSKYDSFQVVHDKNSYKIGKSDINFGTFKSFEPFFDATFLENCHLDKAQIDVSITKILGNNKTLRFFSLKNKQVSDGQKCVSLSGEGMYFIPLHRSWFVGSDTGTIQVGKILSIKMNGHDFLNFVKVGNTWENKIPEFFPDWSLFDHFMQALSTHRVTSRAHTLASMDKPNFVLTIDSKVFNFYLIGQNLWAYKSPEKDWLLASPDFSLLQNMSSNIWTDRHSIALTTIIDSTQNFEVRKNAIETLGVNWSQNIKDVFYKILLNEDETPELKKLLLPIMKQKPTVENFNTLVYALDKTNDKSLLNQISQILKIQNNKGPIINENQSEEIISKNKLFWKQNLIKQK